jgi:hypothetical protein
LKSKENGKNEKINLKAKKKPGPIRIGTGFAEVGNVNFRK